MKKDYMARLERAARWRLPAQEAEDVIADYRDIVGTPPRTEEQLVRDLGKPRDVVMQLTTVRQYRIWLAVFAALTACVLVPGINAVGWGTNLTRLCFALDTWGWVPLMHLGPVLAFFGSVGTLAWFRKNGHRAGKLPRAITVLLAALSVWMIAILVVDGCWISSPQGFAGMWGWKRPTYFGMPLGPLDYRVSSLLDRIITLTQYGGIITTLLGIFALVKARTGDRRWAAVYVLSAAAMIVTVETFVLLCGHDLTPEGISTLTLQWSSLVYYAAVALVGWLGTGVALC